MGKGKGRLPRKSQRSTQRYLKGQERKATNKYLRRAVRLQLAPE